LQATSSADGTSNKVPPPPSSPVSINVVMNTPPSASKPFVVLVKQPQPPPHPPGLPVHTVNNSIALGAHLPIAAVPPAPPPPPPQRWHTSTGSHGLWAAKSSAGTENFCLNSGRVIGGARGIGARGTQGPKVRSVPISAGHTEHLETTKSAMHCLPCGRVRFVACCCGSPETFNV
jgi:hypothetical protein